MRLLPKKRYCAPAPVKAISFDIVRVLKEVPLLELDGTAEAEERVEDIDGRKVSKSNQKKGGHDGKKCEKKLMNKKKNQKKEVPVAILKENKEKGTKNEKSKSKGGGKVKRARSVVEWQYNWLPVSCVSTEAMNHMACLFVLGPLATTSNKNVSKSSRDDFMYWVRVESLRDWETYEYRLMSHGELLANHPYELLRYLHRIMKFEDGGQQRKMPTDNQTMPGIDEVPAAQFDDGSGVEDEDGSVLDQEEGNEELIDISKLNVKESDEELDDSQELNSDASESEEDEMDEDEQEEEDLDDEEEEEDLDDEEYEDNL